MRVGWRQEIRGAEPNLTLNPRRPPMRTIRTQITGNPNRTTLAR